MNYVFPACSKNISKCEAITFFLSDTESMTQFMPITKCTTHDEDKNAINDKYIVSVAKMLAEYCALITQCFLEG